MMMMMMFQFPAGGADWTMDLQGYVWKESDSLCLGQLTSNVDTTSSSNSSLADDSVSYHDQSQSLSLIRVVLCWSLSLSLSLSLCVCVCV